VGRSRSTGASRRPEIRQAAIRNVQGDQASILKDFEDFRDDPIFEERINAKAMYTQAWTQQMELNFKNDRSYGRGNNEMIEKMPVLIMNQVRLSYRTSREPIRDQGSQNAHFGHHLKQFIDTFIHYEITEEECERREGIYAAFGNVIPNVCRTCTAENFEEGQEDSCQWGDQCRYLHVRPRLRLGDAYPRGHKAGMGKGR
jgi:hypothetical protein